MTEHPPVGERVAELWSSSDEQDAFSQFRIREWTGTEWTVLWRGDYNGAYADDHSRDEVRAFLAACKRYDADPRAWGWAFDGLE